MKWVVECECGFKETFGKQRNAVIRRRDHCSGECSKVTVRRQNLREKWGDVEA